MCVARRGGPTLGMPRGQVNDKNRADWARFVRRVITKPQGPFYRRLVAGMPRRFAELKQRRGGAIAK